MSIKFCTIASGSSGNSAFFSTKTTSILIDAGLTGKAITQAFSQINQNIESLSAILITHEHTDHIKGAGVISRKYNLPIYATIGTWEYMSNNNSIGRIAPHNKIHILPSDTIKIGDIDILPFDIPHDASQPVGFSINTNGHKIVIVTDMGHICQNVAEHLYGATLMLVEANHDIEMLKNGPYPSYLKRRILSPTGHLSNIASANMIAQVFSHKTKHILLGHLSHENNNPLLAYEVVKNILYSKHIEVGVDTSLAVALRHNIGKVITL